MIVDTSKIENFENRLNYIKNSIATVADFPQKGVMFRDITTLLEDPVALKDSIDLLYEIYKNEKIDYIAAADARGFIFGCALAYRVGCGLILVRKKGKLPRKTISEDYDLEYGKNTLEISADSLKKGDRVLLIDDLLATGGTAGAMIKLVQKTGAKVISFAFIIELEDLGGAKKIKDLYNIDSFSLVGFKGK